ncbi:MAG: hypothetical protein ACOYOF_18020, partial [Verrucomicrobiaceae bacterium]
GYDKVKVSLMRDSFSENAYTDQVMGWQQDLIGGKTELLGRLVGRKKQRDLMMTTLWRTGVENRLYAGGAPSLNSLTSNDTLKYNDLVVGQSILTPLGATPAYVSMDGNKNMAHGFHVITTSESYGQLKLDPDVKSFLRDAGQRDDTNELFKGGLKRLDGHTVQWFNAVQHPDAGEVGSPYAPYALLGIAIGHASTPVTTTEAITGGRNTANADDTEVHYMKDFPSTTYKFLNGDSLATGAMDYGPYYVNRDFWGYRVGDETAWDAAPYFYVLIANPKNASVQPGKWAIYKIAVSANNGNRFTGMVQKLGPTISGIQHTTCGNVVWDVNVHATYHGPESRVILCNSYGVPIGASPMHGAGALRRAFGAWKDEVGDEVYQRIHRLLYMDSIIGHGVRRDKLGRCTSIMNIVHAVRYYDINHG